MKEVKIKIVDFQIGNSKGVFVAIPYSLKNLKIEITPEGNYLISAESIGLANWKTKIPKGYDKYLGRSNELSPELVESALEVPFNEYIKLLNEKNITVNYSDHSNFWAVLLCA